ncbi:MAG: hypothetical protein WA821_14145 [Anaerolineales bacterium]
MFKNKWSAKKIMVYVVCFVFLFLLSARVSAIVSASADEANLKPIAQTTKNGLTVSINKITATTAKTDLVSCFDYPSNADWLPHVALYDGANRIAVEEMSLINAKAPATSASNHRCYHLIFPKGLSGKTAKLVVEKLQTTIPESLTQAMCTRAQNKMTQSYPGFSFSCNIGDHGIGFSINKMPKGMNEAQAHDLINNALTNTATGPWELTVAVP